jgi:hypothetical protein
MKLMGYGGRSGPSAAALSSLKQYGLIEGRDQALRITPLALQIIHPTNQSEKSEALKQALFQPEIYSEIKAVFGTKIPADQVVRSHLVRNHGFHPNGADKLIKILKENRNYAEGGAVSQQGDLNRVSHSAVESDDDQATFESELPEAGSPVISLLEKKGETLQFRASQKCVVNIRFDGELSQSAISKTIAFLELLQDNYPE